MHVYIDEWRATLKTSFVSCPHDDITRVTIVWSKKNYNNNNKEMVSAWDEENC